MLPATDPATSNFGQSTPKGSNHDLAGIPETAAISAESALLSGAVGTGNAVPRNCATNRRSCRRDGEDLATAGVGRIRYLAARQQGRVPTRGPGRSHHDGRGNQLFSQPTSSQAREKFASDAGPSQVHGAVPARVREVVISGSHRARKNQFSAKENSAQQLEWIRRKSDR